MKAYDFDKRFESGEDITRFLKLSGARRLGVPRQSIITVWVAERLAKQ